MRYGRLCSFVTPVSSQAQQTSPAARFDSVMIGSRAVMLFPRIIHEQQPAPVLPIASGNHVFSLALSVREQMPCNPYIYRDPEEQKEDDHPTDSDLDRAPDSYYSDSSRDGISDDQSWAPPESDRNIESHHMEMPCADPPKKRHCRSLSNTSSEYENNENNKPGHFNFPAIDEVHFKAIQFQGPKDFLRDRHYSGDAAFFSRERHYSGDAYGQNNNNTHKYFSGHVPNLHKPNPVYRSLGSAELIMQTSLKHSSAAVRNSPHESPVPRPQSASSKPFDFTKFVKALESSGEDDHFKYRSMSLSEDHIASNKARRAATIKCISSHRLSRTRSHPCVADKKCGIKRKRPKEHISRPSLDLYKMKENAFPSTRLVTETNNRMNKELNNVSFQCLIPNQALDLLHPTAVPSQIILPQQLQSLNGVDCVINEATEGTDWTEESEDAELHGKPAPSPDGIFGDLDLSEIENN